MITMEDVKTDLHIRLIDQVKLYFMLSEEGKRLRLPIKELMARGLPGASWLQDYDMFNSQLHLADLAALAFVRDTFVGFSLAKTLFKPADVLFPYVSVVEEDLTGVGIGTKMTEALIEQFPAKYMATVTQNPVVYCLRKRFCSTLMPLDTGSVPPRIQEIFLEMLKNFEIRGQSEPDKLIIRGVYRQCPYDEIPCAHNPMINSWFEENLRIQNRQTCDGVFLIGRLDLYRNSLQ